ncbi:MAG TPA: AI-2E family transporter, partial [bacterium]|nr:AI-2E family transporter [bacterium]
MFRWMFEPKNARFAVLLLMALLVAAAVIFLRAVMLPFFLAIFLAYLLDPLVRRMQRLRIRNVRLPRGMAVLFIYAVLGGILVLTGYYGVPKLSVELDRMVRSLPNTISQIEEDLVQPLGAQIDRILNSYVGAPAREPAQAHGKPPQPAGPGPAAGNEAAKSVGQGSEWRYAVENYEFIVR